MHVVALIDRFVKCNIYAQVVRGSIRNTALTAAKNSPIQSSPDLKRPIASGGASGTSANSLGKNWMPTAMSRFSRTDTIKNRRYHLRTFSGLTGWFMIYNRVPDVRLRRPVLFTLRQLVLVRERVRNAASYRSSLPEMGAS